MRKERDAAQSRAEKAERGLESLDYDKAQEDGLVEEKEKEEKAVESLREVNGEACTLGRCDLSKENGRVNFCTCILTSVFSGMKYSSSLKKLTK